MRFLMLATFAFATCGKAEAGPAAPPAAASAVPCGMVEVTAKRLEIPGPFPANKLYDHIDVLKYQVLTVHRGKVDGLEILIGNYTPLKARSAAQEKSQARSPAPPSACWPETFSVCPSSSLSIRPGHGSV